MRTGNELLILFDFTPQFLTLFALNEHQLDPKGFRLNKNIEYTVGECALPSLPLCARQDELTKRNLFVTVNFLNQLSRLNVAFLRPLKRIIGCLVMGRFVTCDVHQ